MAHLIPFITLKLLIDRISVDSMYENESEKEGDLSQLAISGAQDCSIKLWDVHTG